MRRDREEIEETAWNRKLYLFFVRDVKSRGLLSSTLSPLGQAVRTPTVYLFLVCDCGLLRGSDELTSLLVWMWNLRRNRNTERISNRDCHIRCALLFPPFSNAAFFEQVFLPPSSSCTCVIDDGRDARGTESGSAYCLLGHVGEYSPWVSLGRCGTELQRRVGLSHSQRRISGDASTQLIHDRGPPLVFVCGEQECGGG